MAEANWSQFYPQMSEITKIILRPGRYKQFVLTLETRQEWTDMKPKGDKYLSSEIWNKTQFAL